MSLGFETLILRFRDLSTDNFETINSHTEIINNHGYVWWGWWNKLGECITSSIMPELIKLANGEAYDGSSE